MIKEESIKNFLKQRKDGTFCSRENKNLEFKEGFNTAGLTEYVKDFSAFANNSGGYMIFGIKNKPRKLIGLKGNALQSFNDIDPAVITEKLLKDFSSDIEWEHDLFTIKRKKFGVFYVKESKNKPIIAKTDDGKGQEIRNGEIYYRYAGRTQKIQFSELNKIINEKIFQESKKIKNIIEKIFKTGASNVAILDLESGVIENDKNNTLLIDKELISKISFIKEGEFSEVGGAKTLKLIGDVSPINSVEVVKYKKQNLLADYPYSHKKLVANIRTKKPNINVNEINKIIKENGIKYDENYAVFNFRNKEQEDNYKTNPVLPSGVPSIYNENALNLIIKILEQN